MSHATVVVELVVVDVMTASYRCCSIERLPIAQQNTSLSVRNYESTAATARILGADPVLAHLVVTMGQIAMPQQQQQSSSSSSSLSPSPFRKGAVLSLLRMGQSTLGWLAEGSSNNWSGAIRRRALQLWMGRGNSLPLVFPAEDLHFCYREGAVVKRTSNDGAVVKGTSDRIFVAPDDQIDSACNLQIGSRIPHCWLAPTPSSSPLPLPLNQDSSHTLSTAADDDDDDDDDVDDDGVCSSVQLSGVMDALLVSSKAAAATGVGGGGGRSSSARPYEEGEEEEEVDVEATLAAAVAKRMGHSIPTERMGHSIPTERMGHSIPTERMGHSIPTCSLWVSGRYASDAAAAVGEVNRHYFPDAFTVVAVERRRGEEGSLIAPLDHGQLQAQLQNPRYSIPASANDPIRRDQKRITAATTVDHSSFSSSSSSPIVSKRRRKRRRHMLQSSLDDDDARVLSVVDISNRWHELLHRYYNTTNQSQHRVRSSPDTDVKGNDGPVDEMIAVVVRPDGHVAHIFALPRYNHRHDEHHHDHHHRTSSSDDVRRYMQSQLRAVAQALFLIRAKVP